jgi:hypothetical protein
MTFFMDRLSVLGGASLRTMCCPSLSVGVGSSGTLSGVRCTVLVAGGLWLTLLISVMCILRCHSCHSVTLSLKSS